MEDAAIYNPNAPKKSANLSINSDLLKQAKSLKINLSRALEQKLTEMVREEQEQLWRKENKKAIADYNQRVEAKGVFSDGLRRF